MEFKTWEEAVRCLVEQPDKEDLVRACYYDLPLERAAARYRCSDEWNAVRRLLPDNPTRALDLGAGNGIASIALAKCGWDVIAAELDGSDIVGTGAIRRLLRKENLPASVIQVRGESIPLREKAVKLVFARQVLHHAEDLHALCNEISRVLEPGGVLVAVREHVLSRKKHLDRFLHLHPLHRYYGGENAYLLSEYKTALTQSGLKIDVVLGSFDSVINYAPMTETQLKQELTKRIKRCPGGAAVSRFFSNGQAFSNFLRILSMIDRRPGRLFSFVCHKPGEG